MRTVKKADAVDETGYTVTSWRGVVQYQCNACAYDTLELAKAVEHVALVHPVIDVPEAFVPAETPPLETLAEA